MSKIKMDIIKNFLDSKKDELNFNYQDYILFLGNNGYINPNNYFTLVYILHVIVYEPDNKFIYTFISISEKLVEYIAEFLIILDSPSRIESFLCFSRINDKIIKILKKTKTGIRVLLKFKLLPLIYELNLESEKINYRIINTIPIGYERLN